FGIAPCGDDQSNFIVTVEQEVFAGADNLISICNLAGSWVDLNTLLVGADAGGTWTETSASGVFNVVTGILNTDNLAAGDYFFIYDVFGVAPCGDDQSEFMVRVEQELFAGANNSTSVCNTTGSSVDMNTLLTGADAGGTWTETSASGVFNTVSGILNADNLSAGAYTFTYDVFGVVPCGNNQSNFTVVVFDIPNLIALPNLDLCDNQTCTPALFVVDIPGSIVSWVNLTGIDIGFGLSGNGNLPSFTTINETTSDITITIEVTATSPFGCVGTSFTFDIVIHPLPVVSFIADELIGCESLNVSFTNTSTGGLVGIWYFGDGNYVEEWNPTHTFTEVGLYDAGLTVTSVYGCVSFALYSDYINIFPSAVASFQIDPSPISILDTQVDFINSSTNAIGYQWDFGDDSPTSTETDPSHSYPENGNQNYLITLVAVGEGGCNDTVSQLINVEDVILFYIPNTFTPDGNSMNEMFQPVFTSGFDPFDFQLLLFNRWGETIFESHDASIGWGGTYANNDLAQDGTYTWRIEFKETMSDRRHSCVGHVNLLR
ncbi:MAG: gliding motility-associated C-terminal domain-containing protein, partial [Crocinitomicaceae bacterium]|nr:gliding motility-associated C-terminal domain-containing protein [Crocinitomicaceae bacterium]